MIASFIHWYLDVKLGRLLSKYFTNISKFDSLSAFLSHQSQPFVTIRVQTNLPPVLLLWRGSLSTNFKLSTIKKVIIDAFMSENRENFIVIVDTITKFSRTQWLNCNQNKIQWFLSFDLIIKAKTYTFFEMLKYLMCDFMTQYNTQFVIIEKTFY